MNGINANFGFLFSEITYIVSEKILILDFGSQYTQLIARKVREHNVYCEIHPYSKYPEPDESVKGVILSGSPFSVRDEHAPIPNLDAIKGKYPLLGICYGAQYLAHYFGGEVKQSNSREYGRARLSYINTGNALLKDLSPNTQVWMSHGDTINSLPANYEVIASTSDVEVGAYAVSDQITFGLQFHPEVYHTSEGKTILYNFLSEICGCSMNWTPEAFVERTIQELQQKLANDSVVMGLSGGVDSTVAAILLHRAIGENLTCIFVDNGLLRKDEFPTVLESYAQLGLNVIGVDASDKFITDLEGVTDPEAKRKSIGKNFIEVFEQESKKLDNISWLGQGTIYPDVIESVSVNGPSVTIKSHHNVGGLPEKMHLKVVEPLRLLFKDEVRRVGYSMGIPAHFLKRHPFPGPGLGIRILGAVDREKIRLVQEADDIYIKALQRYGLYDRIWQAGAMLLPVQSVGVMGDERTYEYVVALRAVTSTDGMTADWGHLPYEVLSQISNDIINKVRGINRVVYDISSKPPATIEWE